MFLSSWQKEQWVPAPKPILDLVTSLKQKARGSAALHAFLPVFAVCARTVPLCAEPRGRRAAGSGPRSGAPKALCLLWEFLPGTHCSLTILESIFRSTLLSHRETRKPTDRSSKALCRSDVLVLLEERSLDSVNRKNLVEKLIQRITLWPYCLSRNIPADCKYSKYIIYMFRWQHVHGHMVTVWG